MDTPTLFLLTADAVLLIHVLFVAFIVIGLMLIFTGKVYRWPWVRNRWFRVIHLLAIGFVTIQSWFGLICPLTTIEMSLREQAGDIAYTGSFIAHWLETLLYYQAPAWLFALCYTLVAALVVGSWFWVRPRR